MHEFAISSGYALNEQVARQIFENLPDDGPIMLIMDKEGSYWPSDSERWPQLNITESFLKQLCEKIDDGEEPIITQSGDVSLIVAQLATKNTRCGYIIIALPQYIPEFTMLNIDLIELVLNQVNLIADLVEKNHLFYEHQLKHQNITEQDKAILN